MQHIINYLRQHQQLGKASLHLSQRWQVLLIQELPTVIWMKCLKSNRWLNKDNNTCMYLETSCNHTFVCSVVFFFAVIHYYVQHIWLCKIEYLLFFNYIFIYLPLINPGLLLFLQLNSTFGTDYSSCKTQGYISKACNIDDR